MILQAIIKMSPMIFQMQLNTTTLHGSEIDCHKYQCHPRIYFSSFYTVCGLFMYADHFQVIHRMAGSNRVSLEVIMIEKLSCLLKIIQLLSFVFSLDWKLRENISFFSCYNPIFKHIDMTSRSYFLNFFLNFLQTILLGTTCK